MIKSWDAHLDVVPEAVRQAFEGKAALSLAELAQSMRMDQKTLREAVLRGEISFVPKGTGLRRPRRTFTARRCHSYRFSMARPGSPGTSMHSDRALLTASILERSIWSAFDDMLPGSFRYPTRYSDTSPKR